LDPDDDCARGFRDGRHDCADVQPVPFQDIDGEGRTAEHFRHRHELDRIADVARRSEEEPSVAHIRALQQLDELLAGEHSALSHHAFDVTGAFRGHFHPSHRDRVGKAGGELHVKQVVKNGGHAGLGVHDHQLVNRGSHGGPQSTPARCQ
jgi:hypothetical protein